MIVEKMLTKGISEPVGEYFYGYELGIPAFIENWYREKNLSIK
jgi:hypothetical protein